MNNKTTYEQLITEKLQHLPLPDMEDAIWSRIHTQLDLELPTTDDGGDSPPEPPAGGGWIWRAGMVIFVAALITTFLLLKKEDGIRQPLPANSTLESASASSAGDEQPVEQQPPERPGNSRSSSGSGTGIVLNDNVDGNAAADSTLQVPTVNMPLPDTTQQLVLTDPPQVAQDTTLPKKKGEGSAASRTATTALYPLKKTAFDN